MTGDGHSFGRGQRLLEWTASTARWIMGTTRLDQAGDALFSGTLAELQSSSVWPAAAGMGCCSVQTLSVRGPRWDPEGFGSVFQDHPEGCDVLLVDGPLTRASKLELPALVERMAEPRWVIAMGSCAISGGPFQGGYAVLGGVDQAIPVDIYIPGCPPTPEAVLLGLVKLSELVRRDGGPYLKVPSGEGGLL